MVVSIGMLAPSQMARAATPEPISALVLYDAPPNDSYSKLGLAYAIMLRNLLGHFDGTITLKPVQEYTAGMIESYQATFYLGSHYDNAVPAALLSDVTTTQKTVVWFKYNLWQVAWNVSYPFTQRYGITFSGLRGLDSTPSSSNPKPGFFDTVVYKNTDLVKYYDFNTTTGVVRADPDIGVTQVADATKAQVLVTIRNSKTNELVPYIVRSGNFWYVADIPFSFIGPRDRYLVMCDILHSMVNRSSNHTGHKAMVRLEDVGALVSVSAMRQLTDYLSKRRIPFSIATIPLYRDPLGKYNGGVPEEIPLALATGLKGALNYAIPRGGKIVMHGYTHQYDSMANPHTGVSGDDFEFWNSVANRPVDEDSTDWAGDRLDSGLADLTSNGYTPFAWEAPHYQSSPLSIAAVPPRFRTTYQRVVYYTGENPDLNSTAGNRDFSVGQFFPYIIKHDYYGQRVLPENLGNIEYNICNIDPSSCLTYTWQDLLLNAKYALLVQDGYASFFFHPFWLEPEVGTPGMRDFKSLVNGITQLGYQWVDASTQ